MFKQKLRAKKAKENFKKGIYALEVIVVSAALVALCALLMAQFKVGVKTAGDSTNKVMIESITPTKSSAEGGSD